MDWMNQYKNEIEHVKLSKNSVDRLKKQLNMRKGSERRNNRTVRYVAAAATLAIVVLFSSNIACYAMYGVNLFGKLTNHDVAEINNQSGISQGLVAEKTNYVYMGEDLVIPYHVSTDAKTVGYLLFLDGIPQPYRVKQNGVETSQSEYMHRFAMGELGSQDFEFVVKPISGRNGEKKKLTIKAISNPDYVPESEDYVSYGLSSFASGNSVVTVDLKTDAGQMLASAIKTQKVENGAEKTQSIRCELREQGGCDLGYFLSKKGTVNLVVRNQVPVDGKYIVTLFVNHQPITLEGGDFVEFDGKAQQTYESFYSIDISGNERMNTVYAFATLVGNENELQEKSSHYALVNDMKPSTQVLDEEKTLPSGMGSNLDNLNQLEQKHSYEKYQLINSDKLFAYDEENNVLRLYDMSMQKEVAVSEMLPSDKVSIDRKQKTHNFVDYDIIQTANGYVAKIVQDTKFKARNGDYDFQNKIFFVYFTKELKILKMLPIDSKESKYGYVDCSASNYIVSPSGQYIAYYDTADAQLKIWDVESGIKKKLLDMSVQKNKLVAINAMRFGTDDSHIYYCGVEYVTQDKKSEVIGVLNTHGNNQYFKAENYVGQDIRVTEEGAFFSDGGLSRSGKLAFMTKDGICKVINLDTKLESLNEVQIDGNKIITKDESNQIRVYLTESGKMDNAFQLEGKKTAVVIIGLEEQDEKILYMVDGKKKVFKVVGY